MHASFNLKKGTHSIRFFPIHDEQFAVIREALRQARHEAHTEFDAVALEAICQSYLTGRMRRVACRRDRAWFQAR